MKQKRCVELHILHYNPQRLKHCDTLNCRRRLCSLIELASLYTVPLSAVMVWVVWLSLRREKEQVRPIRFENFWIGQSLSNRIESDGRFEFESNLEASQAPKTSVDSQQEKSLISG